MNLVICLGVSGRLSAHNADFRRRELKESLLLVHSHATDDIQRLRLGAVAGFLHVRDRHRDVDVHAAEISVSEHLEVRREEILQQKMRIKKK